MNRRNHKIRWIALALISLFLLAGFFLLRIYRLDLIQTVILREVIQKALSDPSPKSIRAAFARAQEEAVQTGQQDLYLERLFQVSQRLEKVQTLTSSEVRELLDQLEGPPVTSE